MSEKVDRLSRVIELICGEKPPRQWVEMWVSWDESWVEPEDPYQPHPLQEWAANHASEPWMTGIEIIEAAEHLVSEGLIDY